MTHKTLIGGTAYEISGGRTLVNGTGYDIDKGETLVGGTAYEVGFASKTVTIEVRGDGREYIGDGYGEFAEANITHNGVTYDTTATFQAAVGDTIKCYADATDSTNVYVNGVKVSGWNYTYTVTENAIIYMEAGQYDSSYEPYYCSFIDIIEIPSGFYAFQYVTTFSNYDSYGISPIRIAKMGMTWAEWCNSEYNQKYTNYYARIVIDGDYVRLYLGSVNAITMNGVFVKPTDVVLPMYYGYKRTT